MKRRLSLVGIVAIVFGIALWRHQAHHSTAGMTSVATPVEHASLRTDPRRVERASLAGTVRDVRGAPITAARVCAFAWSRALPGDLTRAPACAATDVRGAFLIAGLYAADYQVSAMATQFSVESFTPHGADQPVQFPLAAGEARRGIDIVLHRGGAELAGTVTDISGGTIPRAHVHVDATGPRYGTAPIVVDTDERGHYTVWVNAGAINVTAAADGYAQTLRNGNAPATLDVVLVPESTLSGTVVDATTGARLANISVTATPADESFAPVDSTMTDDEGRFSLTQLQPGRYIATATSPHGTGTEEGSTQLGLGQHVDGLEVRLFPAHQIVAHILDPSGAVCTAGTVALFDTHHAYRQFMFAEPDGTLRADGVLSGTYDVSVSCDGFIARDQYDPVVVADHDVAVKWTVATGATITGRVRTADGAAVALADIEAQSIGDAPRAPNTFQFDRSAHDGGYTLRGLRPGRYRVIPARAGRSGSSGDPSESMVEVEVKGTETVHRDLVLRDAGGSIVGSVTSSDGSPIGRVELQAHADTTTYVTSDDAGHFEITNLVPGVYQLIVSHAGHGSVNNIPADGPLVTVVADQATTAKLVVDPPIGTIRGVVLDDQGAPITDAFVGVGRESDASPSIQAARSDDQEILAGTDGRFVASRLEAGRYTVRAYRKGGGEVVESHVDVDSTITLTLAATGSITGVVRQSGGTVDDFRIEIIDRDTDTTLRYESFFHTAGRFALRDVSVGHYRVVVLTGGAQQVVTVDLAAGQQATLDVELDSLVTLVGELVDARTLRPIGGATMYASLDGVGLSTWSPFDHRNTTDASGHFEIPAVSRGATVISGSSIDEGGQRSRPVTIYRTITTSDPAVIDLGQIRAITTTISAPSGNSGFEVAASDGAVRVTAVEPGGVADREGLVVGDVITAIDGIDVTGAASRAAGQLMDGDVGTTIVLELERGVTVTIVLA
jgi:protocatechuate 3,4-dioxygenase beta subunit